MEIIGLLLAIYFICLYVAYKGASVEKDDWKFIYFYNIKKGDVIRVINKHLEDANYSSAIMGVVIEDNIVENNNKFIVIEVKSSSGRVRTLKLNLFSGSYEKLVS